jgi:chromosome segregation ATPase
MIEQLTSDTEFWRPIMPYIGGIIIAFCVLIAGVLIAIRTLINNGVKKDTAQTEKESAQVEKEKTYLALVNDLRVEVADLKKDRIKDEDLIRSLQDQIKQLQDDFLAAKEREIEREKELATLTLERDALKKELTRIAGELENLRKEIQRLIDERNALNAKLEMERQLRQEAEIARIKVENNLEKERSILNSQIESLQNKVAVLEQSIDLLKKATQDDIESVMPEDESDA